ncbi:hypothetical protein BCR43DRAFT_78900 [Syncephalastrum racemosum]|uniref:SH3 domain-containing protein n=1 Tax=Syncephalastrum racemosum TaxID=13706 RepID=A0A1X2H2P6_SYNRA|nr:hypothetical protein BCR43DRAFT_78900 [Syncephalastrum racemosum]
MDSYGAIYPLSNPLVLTTSVFACCGWLILFIGACVAALHGVSWWVIIFELFFTVGIIATLGVSGFGPHRGTMLTLLAISIVYLTYVIPLMLYNDQPGARAATGGAIILIIMQYFWVFLLGMSEESRLYRMFYGGGSGGGFSGGNIGGGMMQSNWSSAIRPHNKEAPLPTVQQNTNAGAGGAAAGGAAAGGASGGPPTPAQKNSQFETATALHSYQANPEDPNELSFGKDESLEILDRKGNWWQARKEDGSVGIVPSNYFSS